MRKTWVTIKVLFWLCVVGLPVLFVIQNRLRVTELSLDLGFVAWKLAEPVAIPYLLMGTLGAGVLLGVLLSYFWRRRREHSESYGSESASSASESW